MLFRSWNKYLEDRSQSEQGPPRGASGMEELPPIETNLVGKESIAEHLEWQLQMTSCTDAERAAALIIVNNLDDRGWLSVSLEDLIAENGLDSEDAEGALDIVQHLDPLGCGARNLEECLLVQVGVHWPGDGNFEAIIRGHLADIEKRNYVGIAKALQIEVEDVVEYHKMLKILEPWPGRIGRAHV